MQSCKYSTKKKKIRRKKEKKTPLRGAPQPCQRWPLLGLSMVLIFHLQVFLSGVHLGIWAMRAFLFMVNYSF